MRRTRPLDVRFFEKVQKGDDCWEWIGGRYRNGYGKMFANGSYRLAHRFSYQMSKGEIPEGAVIMHSCNNPGCVNPEHLSAGTPRENIQYMVKCKRRVEYDRRGSDNPRAKIDEQDVIAIRSAVVAGDMTLKAIGHFFGISKTQVGHIVKGKTWSHVAFPDGWSMPIIKNKAASKISEAQVKEIRRLHDEKFSTKELGDKFKLCTSSISNIVTRRTWAHVA